jgi:hypothetical protein
MGTGRKRKSRLDFFGYIRYDDGMEFFEEFLDVLKAFQKEKLEYILEDRKIGEMLLSLERL